MKSYKQNADSFAAELSKVMEPRAEYERAGSDVEQNDLFFSDLFAMRKIVHDGVSQDLFASVKKKFRFTDAMWAELLAVSLKSLQRYEASKKAFGRLQSQRILELAEVAHTGRTIFNTEEDFWAWLETPSIALGSLRPVDLLGDSYGKELVVAELIRIEHGIFL